MPESLDRSAVGKEYEMGMRCRARCNVPVGLHARPRPAVVTGVSPVWRDQYLPSGVIGHIVGGK